MNRTMLVGAAMAVGAAMIVALGCTAAPPAATPTRRDDTPGWTRSHTAHPERAMAGARYDDSGRPLDTASVRLGPPPGDPFATRHIEPAAAPAAARPRRVGKRNVSLKAARLDNALRMLAREGRFNLVLQGDLTAPVTVELHGVEPYDAALVIAHANNLRMQYESGIVMVSRGSGE
jgi:hypothetical protein